jgi:tetratricopeptide (TPR) repeat protein
MSAGAWLVLVLLLPPGCAVRGPDLGRDPALRLSELTDQGDRTRQASLRLVIDGLDADAQRDARRARGSYARALQVDSGNPYAYLALARHHVEAGDASRALQHLARARDLLASERNDSPRVEVHLVGLRGIALRELGRSDEARPLLAYAARRAPSVWGDGRLSAEELR